MPHEKPKRKWNKILFLPFWLLIIVMSAGLCIMQASRYTDYQKELNRVLTELENAKQEYEKLQDQIAYYDSDAYIEQLARDQLGYVKPDEIVFINVSD